MSSKKLSGGRAFPRNCSETNTEYCSAQEGMTLRDYFAAKAMQGFLAYRGDELKISEASKYAYEIADAMIAARRGS